jgi:hypothetical protein
MINYLMKAEFTKSASIEARFLIISLSRIKSYSCSFGLADSEEWRSPFATNESCTMFWDSNVDSG